MNQEYVLEKLALKVSSEQLLQAIANRAKKVKELTKIPQDEALVATLTGSEAQLKRLGANLEGTGADKAREITQSLKEGDLPTRFTAVKEKRLTDLNLRNNLLERMGNDPERWNMLKSNFKVTDESIVKAVANRIKKTGDTPQRAFEKAKPQLENIEQDASKILSEPYTTDFSKGKTERARIVNFIKGKNRKEGALQAKASVDAVLLNAGLRSNPYYNNGKKEFTSQMNDALRKASKGEL